MTCYGNKSSLYRAKIVQEGSLLDSFVGSLPSPRHPDSVEFFITRHKNHVVTDFEVVQINGQLAKKQSVDVKPLNDQSYRFDSRSDIEIGELSSTIMCSPRFGNP